MDKCDADIYQITCKMIHQPLNKDCEGFCMKHWTKCTQNKNSGKIFVKIFRAEILLQDGRFDLMSSQGRIFMLLNYL